MDLERFTLLDAIRTSIAMEDQGVLLYTFAIEKAANPEVKIMSRLCGTVTAQVAMKPFALSLSKGELVGNGLSRRARPAR